MKDENKFVRSSKKLTVMPETVNLPRSRWVSNNTKPPTDKTLSDW